MRRHMSPRSAAHWPVKVPSCYIENKSVMAVCFQNLRAEITQIDKKWVFMMAKTVTKPCIDNV